MSIPQAAFGAVIAATLVFTPGTARVQPNPLRLSAGAALHEARQCGDAVLTFALDAAGDLVAHFKRI